MPGQRPSRVSDNQQQILPPTSYQYTVVFSNICIILRGAKAACTVPAKCLSIGVVASGRPSRRPERPHRDVPAETRGSRDTQGTLPILPAKPH